MNTLITFKRACIGFVNENQKDSTKPYFCAHYLKGKCTFFLNNIDCDDVENEQLRS